MTNEFMALLHDMPDVVRREDTDISNLLCNAHKKKKREKRTDGLMAEKRGRYVRELVNC